MPIKKVAQAQPNLLLRHARQERGWSQQEVADLVGAPHAYMVTRWENGTARPGPAYREKLCTVFGKSGQELGLVKQPVKEVVADRQAPVSDPTIPLRTTHARRLVGREQTLAQLKEQLCGADPIRVLAIDGLPGVGKTILAAELAIAHDVQSSFFDGVLWAGLGPKPNIQAHLRRWCTLVGIAETEQSLLHDSRALAEALRQVLWNRRMLLVLDDAWNIDDALACMVGGQDCAYLLTTRIPEVATRFAGRQSIHLGELSLEEGMQLLVQITPIIASMKPEIVRDLVRIVGALPLALTLMGNYLLQQARHGQRRRLQAAIAQLQQAETRLRLEQPQAGLERDDRLPTGMPLTLQAMIALSDGILQEEERQVFYDLAVFPARPASFSETSAQVITRAPAKTLDRLVDVGLLERMGNGRYSLHQTIADYVRSQSEKRCPGGAAPGGLSAGIYPGASGRIPAAGARTNPDPGNARDGSADGLPE